MQTPVFFAHAAGDPDHPEGSGRLIAWLAERLGNGYRVIGPRMPEPDEPHYGPWRDTVHQHLVEIGEPAIVIGHSFGGSVLVKYLAEGSAPAVQGLFLADVPFWGPGGWEYPEYDLQPDFAGNLPRVPTFLYHSRQDPEVPFAHLGLYAAQMPWATVRELPGGEHSFTDGLPELAADIESLAQARER